MKVNSLRFYSFLPFFGTVVFLAYALYTEYYLYLSPCPLCMVQRYIYILIGILFFITFVKPPITWGRKLFGFLKLLVSGLGMFVAGWHVRLQHLPPEEVPDCGPGLDYMLEVFPWKDIMSELINGSGDCAEVVWSFLGLSMPTWSFICFVGYFFYTIFWMRLKQRLERL